MGVDKSPRAAELKALTGRTTTTTAMMRMTTTTKKTQRPTHGRLFKTPATTGTASSFPFSSATACASTSSRLSFGSHLLGNVSIEGTRMRVPEPPHRSHHPFPSDPSYYPRRTKSARGDGVKEGGVGRSVAAAVFAEVRGGGGGGGDVRVVITPRMRQRLSALDLQCSPITARGVEADRHGEWPACRCARFEDHMRLFRYKDSDRHLILRVGKTSQKRNKDDPSRKLQRKAYSTPLYDPDTLRKSRTVRFEAPRTASSSPQPMVLPEQIDVPLAVFEDDTTLLEAVEESPENTDSKPAATSSPRQPITAPSPRPSPLSDAAQAKPKPKPKKERPQEKTPRQVAARPKPVERPPPPPPAPAAPPKPVKLPRAPPPKPVKEPRVARPKAPPREKRMVPKPAPKAPPPVKKEKPKEQAVDKPVPLPISPPEEINSPEPAEEEPPPPPVARAPLKKKEKLPPPPPRRRTPTPPPKPPTPVQGRKGRGDWIFSSDEEEEKGGEKEKEEEPVTMDLLPTLPPSLPTPTPVASPRGGGAGRGGGVSGRSGMNLSLVAIKSRPRWGQKQRDTSLLDAAERERLAEERRRRHAAMVDRHRRRKGGEPEGGEGEGPHFEDSDVCGSTALDGFLAKYCILNPSTTDKYRYTFEHLDEGNKGYLTEEETAYGLRAINPSLSVSERTYLFRVLEIAGHKMKLGTDLKLFSILAALSQRVSRLDEWARNMMAELDYRNLEMKLFLCKTLWECNVDESSNTISLDQLIVELRAGGVSPRHEHEVRTKLADHRFLDFFDFLMYVPLFIMIHETVVTDPLSVSRTS
ncbi:uncharacterized protein LOC143297650 [Babylonia areolata]|uniref:uncharacterized protein LOC143297650 n=1 Tax=Babylonia areolata TaxID=304850 RepID=UPI003FCF0FF5